MIGMVNTSEPSIIAVIASVLLRRSMIGNDQELSEIDSCPPSRNRSGRAAGSLLEWQRCGRRYSPNTLRAQKQMGDLSGILEERGSRFYPADPKTFGRSSSSALLMAKSPATIQALCGDDRACAPRCRCSIRAPVKPCD